MIINRDLRMLKIAKQISMLSDYTHVPMGCCIAIKNEILSVGCNGEKTNPLQMKFDKFRNFNNPKSVIHKQHCEISAISKLPWYVYENGLNLQHATIYIFRQYKNTHTYACALPCPACRKAIEQVKIGRIVATVENGITEIRI